MSLTFPDICLAILVVAIGTAVQASLGFGLAMIAAPLLLLLDPALVPGPLLAMVLFLSLWVVWQERHALEFSHFKAAIFGRSLGILPALLLIGTVSTTTFDLVLGTLVLLAVGMSLLHSKLQPTPTNIFIATGISGFMETLSSIGGPPLALVYQNVSGPKLRANLAMLFVLGTIMSLVGLSLVGRFGVQELAYSAYLLGGVLVGVLCSGPIKKRADKTTVRPYLLGLCFISACGVLVRAALVLWGG